MAASSSGTPGSETIAVGPTWVDGRRAADRVGDRPGAGRQHRHLAARVVHLGEGDVAAGVELGVLLAHHALGLGVQLELHPEAERHPRERAVVARRPESADGEYEGGLAGDRAGDLARDRPLARRAPSPCAS